MPILNTTTSLNNEVALYYEKKFLERARAMLVHQDGAQFRGIEGNVGKTVIFNRLRPLSLVTTPLTEGNNPTPVSIVDDQVTVTLQDFGNTVQITRLLTTTDIDDRAKEKIDLMAQNMGRVFAHVKSLVKTMETLRYGCIMKIHSYYDNQRQATITNRPSLYSGVC
jgi:N4-gp56 family major capsid protein